MILRKFCIFTFSLYCRRHITIDYPSHDQIEDQNGLLQSSGRNIEGENEKKMPTIIKYSGQGRDVFVCGTNFFFREIIPQCGKM